MNQETSLTRSKPSTKKKMNTQLMAEKKKRKTMQQRKLTYNLWRKIV